MGATRQATTFVLAISPLRCPIIRQEVGGVSRAGQPESKDRNDLESTRGVWGVLSARHTYGRYCNQCSRCLTWLDPDILFGGFKGPSPV